MTVISTIQQTIVHHGRQIFHPPALNVSNEDPSLAICICWTIDPTQVADLLHLGAPPLGFTTNSETTVYSQQARNTTPPPPPQQQQQHQHHSYSYLPQRRRQISLHLMPQHVLPNQVEHASSASSTMASFDPAVDLRRNKPRLNDILFDPSWKWSPSASILAPQCGIHVGASTDNFETRHNSPPLPLLPGPRQLS